ncbi:thioesterase family protein [Palleronia rufa]|uniref:thioesterase family protein n=1 Tax=Palleronia rufa TaxID=1530186 RepID=UPI00068924EC|nr:thioesterase family protein [Palleronia rufa]
MTLTLAAIGCPDWAARGAVMGAAVRHTGRIDPDLLARVRRALPGLYDRTPPRGSLTAVAEPEAAVRGADLVLAAPGTLAAAPRALMVAVGGPDPLAGATLGSAQPAYLMPEVTLAGPEASAAAALLAPLGVARVAELTPVATDGAPDADAALVGLLRALRAADHGPGRIIAATDAAWPRPVPDWSGPVETADRAIPLDWTDYNGHMTEARYLHAFGDATDRLMAMLGCGPAYIAAGHSFFTAETHIRHLGECHAGDRIRVLTQAIAVSGPKMRFFHTMWRDGVPVATGEHFMLHVSLATRRPAAPLPPLDAGMARFGAAGLPIPPGAGRAVGQPR